MLRRTHSARPSVSNGRTGLYQVMLFIIVMATHPLNPAAELFTAGAWGDPVITTVDGHIYSFNGRGEYILLNTSGFQLQARTEYLHPNVPEATVFTDFAMKTRNTTIQFHYDRTPHEISLYVNGKRNEKIPTGPPLSVPTTGRPDILLRNVSGQYTVTIPALGGGTVVVVVSESSSHELGVKFQGIHPKVVTGLAGKTKNGSFLYRNGTSISINSTESEVYDFGESWSLRNETESLFNYSITGENFEFYNNASKPRPRFLDELVNNLTALFKDANASTIHLYNQTCRGIKECLLAIARSGDLQQGLDYIKKIDREDFLHRLTVNKPPIISSETTNVTVFLGDHFILDLTNLVEDDDKLKFTVDDSMKNASVDNNGTLKWDISDYYRNKTVRFNITVQDEFNLTAYLKLPMYYCGCKEKEQCNFNVLQSLEEESQFYRASCDCDDRTKGTFCEERADPCDVVHCAANVSCNSSKGFPNPCGSCPVGYSGDGTKCEDIDECTHKNSTFGSKCEQKCTNTIGSFYCSCNEGYELVGSTNCTDIDECKRNSSICKHYTDSKCVNLPGNVSCECDPGWYLDNNTCKKGGYTYVAEIVLTKVEIKGGTQEINTPENRKEIGQQLTDMLKGNHWVLYVEVISITLTQARRRRSTTTDTTKYKCKVDFIIHTKNMSNEENLDSVGQELANKLQTGGSKLGQMSVIGAIEQQIFSDTENKLCDIEGRNDCDLTSTKCQGANGSIVCSCNPGFSVIPNSQNFCTDLNECKTGTYTCSNHGKCLNLVGDWTCICPQNRMLQRIDHHLIQCQGNFQYIGDVVVSWRSNNTFNSTTISQLVNTTVSELMKNKSLDVSHGEPVIYKLFVYAEIVEPITNTSTKGDIQSLRVEFILRIGERVNASRLTDVLTKGCKDDCTRTKNNETFTLQKFRVYDGSENSSRSICDIENKNPCDKTTTTCKDFNGSISCECKDGFEKLGNSPHFCTDVDECEKGTTYHCNGTCVNTIGNWSCECPTGYEMHRTDKYTIICADINECELKDRYICPSNNCTNTDGNWTCGCSRGYNATRLSDYRYECEDINECLDHDCGIHGNCTNIPGSWNCNCSHGYGFNSTNEVCEDIDECSMRDKYICDVGGGTCSNSQGSWNCTCQDGYQLKKITDYAFHCDDFDECESSICIHGECSNKAGNWSCICEEGRTPSRINKTLIRCQGNYKYFGKVDVCWLSGSLDNKTIKTATNETIKRLMTNRTIDPEMYTLFMYAIIGNITMYEVRHAVVHFELRMGDNVTVERLQKIFNQSDIDHYPNHALAQFIVLKGSSSPLCSRPGENQCDPATTTCTDNEGYAVCICKEGYKSVGHSKLYCEDINECDNKSLCSDNGSCVNTRGNWSCECDEGFRFNSTTMKCEEINECKDENYTCRNGTCTNLSGSWKCRCDSGFQTRNIDKFTKQCVDTNECEDEKYQSICQRGRCKDVPGSWTCDCDPGFGLMNYSTDNITCIDIDECNMEGNQDYQCNGNGTCSNLQGSWICTCHQGYSKAKINDKIYNCSDIDECKRDFSCVDASSCINTVGSWTCLCPTGTTVKNLNSTSKICSGDYQYGRQLELHVVARNLSGNYHKQLKQHVQIKLFDMYYAVLGKTLLSIEILSLFPDESGNTNRQRREAAETYVLVYIVHTLLQEEEGVHKADDTWAQQEHFNKDMNEAFKIFILHRQGPKDIDVCGISEKNHCNRATSECSSDQGSVRCECKDGFEKSSDSELICEDIEECKNHKDSFCGDWGRCVDIPGNWTCVCNQGYKVIEYSRDNKTCQDIDECKGERQGYGCTGNFAVCDNTNGGFECACATGFHPVTADNRTYLCEQDCVGPSCGKSSTLRTALIGVGGGAAGLVALLLISVFGIYKWRSTKTGTKPEEMSMNDYSNGFRDAFLHEPFPYRTDKNYDYVSRESLRDDDSSSSRLAIPRVNLNGRASFNSDNLYAKVDKRRSLPEENMNGGYRYSLADDTKRKSLPRVDLDRMNRMNGVPTGFHPPIRSTHEPPEDYL